jgi:tetraacyldisaccharide 4'-kinase
MRALAGRQVVAFAGIGRPAKFFATLAEAGLELAAVRSFADHHGYTAADLGRLRAVSAQHGAVLVTTEKDFVRLAPADRAGIVPLAVSLAWHDERGFDAWLRARIADAAP